MYSVHICDDTKMREQASQDGKRRNLAKTALTIFVSSNVCCCPCCGGAVFDNVVHKITNSKKQSINLGNLQ